MNARAARGASSTSRGPVVEVGILGPLSVAVDGLTMTISSRRQRALLALLALNVGRALPVERLIEELWDGSPPPQATVTLRSYVSNLRQVLGGRDSSVLVTRGQGYALDISAEAVDAVRLRRLVGEGRSRLDEGEASAALDAFSAALDLWRGDPLSEIAEHVAAQGSVLQLTELHVAALQGQHEALLALGRHGEAVPGLEMLVADHPLREGPRELLMLALYRSGRAPDALEVHRAYRHLLRDQQGLDPGLRLDALVRQILTRDPSLEVPAPAQTASRSQSGEPDPVPTPAPEALPRVSLVGRTLELEHLRAQLARVAGGGPGALVLLSGEAGIGKSTLFEAVHAMAEARGLPVHAGRSPAASGTPAFWPWTQVLTSVADALTDEQLTRATAGRADHVRHVVRSIAERAGAAVPVTGDDPAVMRFLLYEAVTVFLDQALGGRPTVVLLDDLHLADPPSLELLVHLTPSLRTLPLLVVASYRDVPASRTPALEAALATVSPEDYVYELALRRLSRDEVDSLAKQLAASSQVRARPPEDFAELLFDRTGGNPFLVRQLGSLLLEADPPAADPRAVPQGIRHVMSSRLNALTPPALRLLEAASVVGRDFDLAVAASAAGMALTTALDAYDDAARHGLVEPAQGTGHRFVHALFQEAVLASVSPGRSIRLHAAVGRQLESMGAPVDLVAEHLWLARDLVGTAAVPHLVTAADDAAAVLAYEQAEHDLRRAADLLARASPPDHQRELGVLLKLLRLVAAARGWGGHDAAVIVARARRLAAIVGVRGDTLQLWCSLWLGILGRNEGSTADDLAATLIDQVAPGEVSAAAVTARLMSAFRNLARSGRQGEALLDLQAAAALAEAAPDEELAAFDEHLAVLVQLTQALAAAMQGRTADQWAAARGAIRIAEADGRPFPRAVARTLAAQSAALAGNAPHDVRTLVDAALEINKRFGYAYLSGQASDVDAWVRAHLGGSPLDEATRLQKSTDDLLEAGIRGAAYIPLCLLGDVYALAGNERAARDAYLAARATPGAYGSLVIDMIDRRLGQ